jgi:hypothetical protein
MRVRKFIAHNKWVDVRGQFAHTKIMLDARLAAPLARLAIEAVSEIPRAAKANTSRRMPAEM